MIDVQAALASVKKVDEAVGIIGKLVSKLKGQPDLAAVKLAEALDEVAKTWQVMDEAMTQYLKLGVDADALEKGSETLLKIEGGGLLVRVKEGRGHCHVIGNIFSKYLNRWFERVLKGKKLDGIRKVFYTLGNADDDVFRHMEHVAAQLQTEANAVLDLVIKGENQKARNTVLARRADLHPLRLAISGTMTKLYGLKSEFIKIAGMA